MPAVTTATDTAESPHPAPSLDLSYRLTDNLDAHDRQVFLTGTQALVRLPLMQRELDRAAGLNTAGFISGYRGSPLGMFDQQLWKAKERLQAAGIEFLPAINEDLAATACLGTQRVALDAARRVDGVFAMWYGKGPGLDRAGDALKHGNAFGSSALGGVLVVVGDDHGCVSSSMPHQSDLAMQAWSIPVLHPANVAEYLEFGLYGWALSRFSGAWAGLKAISEVVESAMTVDLARVPYDFEHGVDWAPPVPLHVRAGDLPSLEIERRLSAKLDAVRAFARCNSVDKHIVASPAATLGIVTVGKAHFDFMEVLRRLQLDPDVLAAAGVRVYKVGLAWPLEPTRIAEFAHGLSEILVIEEKAPVVERQIKELLYHLPDAQRPRVVGKRGADGRPLLPETGELRPSRIMPVLAEWLARLNPALDRRELVVDFTMPTLLSNAADAVKRQPYFCSGCPHNRSTQVPEGSRALAGIGCHFMASWMDRDTGGLIQMGGEGVDWVAHSRFTREPHVFQNLGDGTYYHSGYLAIRQAVAAGARITYKILYNDAVAMTGGQPVDGTLSVPRIARQVEAEGARRVAVVSDDIGKYRGHEREFPAGTSFHDRHQLDAVQRELREVAGVTVLIYDQTCAAEKRRRRKKGEYPDPPRRIFINEQVCEGCGDCGRASNCLSVIPVDTDLGRKRAIDQTSCNKDYSCVDGFCPSFVSVQGAVLRKPAGSSFSNEDLRVELARIAAPAPWRWSGPFDLLVTGVGGTGVVTVGALVTMAAHLEGKQASVLDFMGFAQKGGAVLSFVRLAQSADQLNQVRIDTQQADAVLACDLVVAASPEAVGTIKHGRTVVLANLHELPTAAFVRNPDADLHRAELLGKLRFAAGAERVHGLDAQALCAELLGDTMPANIVMLGFAFQHGLVPISEAALMRAIELNGVAAQSNREAFAIGRLAAVAPDALRRLARAARAMGATGARAGLAAGVATAPAGAAQPEAAGAAPMALDGPDGLIARRERLLTAYQGTRYARRYRALVERARQAEQSFLLRHRLATVDGATAGGARTDGATTCDAPASSGTAFPATSLRLTAAVAHHFAKLMAYKDEYEVARLYTDGNFRRQLAAQFERWDTLHFHMAPPLLARRDADGHLRKIRFGGWMLGAMRVLASLRGLRGTFADPFGWTAERRLERQLIDDYEAIIDETLQALASARADEARVRHAAAVRIASVPERIRGYGHVKLANIAQARAEWRAALDRLHGRPSAAAGTGERKVMPIDAGATAGRISP